MVSKGRAIATIVRCAHRGRQGTAVSSKASVYNVYIGTVTKNKPLGVMVLIEGLAVKWGHPCCLEHTVSRTGGLWEVDHQAGARAEWLLTD